jgi:hypothetical protein
MLLVGAAQALLSGLRCALDRNDSPDRGKKGEVGISDCARLLVSKGKRIRFARRPPTIAGQAFGCKGDYDRIIAEFFDDAAGRDPTGDFDRALTEYGEAIRIEPEK